MGRDGREETEGKRHRRRDGGKEIEEKRPRERDREKRQRGETWRETEGKRQRGTDAGKEAVGKRQFWLSCFGFHVLAVLSLLVLVLVFSSVVTWVPFHIYC